MTAEKNRRTQAPAKKNGAAVSVLMAVSLVLTAVMLLCLLPYVGVSKQNTVARIYVPDLPDRLDQKLTSMGSILNLDAENLNVLGPRPVYKLNDADLIAPMPDPSCYGQAANAAELLSWFPKKAAGLMGGEKLYFSEECELLPGSDVRYYLDDSIATVVWKEKDYNTQFVFAEVKIADASQFRRFLAGGKFGAETQFTTTEMAQSVNAVVASSGDFYKFRYNGIVVYDGEVRRVNTNKADTCHIDDNGDLIFTYQNETMSFQEAQDFVDTNNIRFSLTFGPVLVDNGQRCEPKNYDLGEINQFSARAAICQMGPLHYLLVTADPSADDDCPGRIDLHQFAEKIAKTGCIRAYTLDGGQTAVIALNGELQNAVLYGYQRQISDIIYFATAVGG